MDVGRTAHLDDSGRGNVWCFNLLVFHGQTLHKRVTPDLRGGGNSTLSKCQTLFGPITIIAPIMVLRLYQAL